MSSGIETVDVIEAWLYDTLSSDAALAALVGDRVVGTLAPGDVPTPYVVFFLSSASDVSAVPTIRIQVDAIYTVKAVGDGAAWGQVRDIAARVDELLHGVNTTTSNGQVSCVRQSIVQYAEVNQGTQFRHLGGLFRVRANGTT